MRSPGKRAAPRHRAPSGAAQAQASRSGAAQPGGPRAGRSGRAGARRARPARGGLTAALRWFGPLARWLHLSRSPHLSGASQSVVSQPGVSQPARPSPSAERTVPFAGAGVSTAQTGGPTAQTGGPTAQTGGPTAGAGGPTAGVSGSGNPAGASAGNSGPEVPPKGSADVTGPLVGISGQSGIPAGRPAVRRDRPGRGRFGIAMRRLMVTPTFAAGLGVVVAASLAANMTKTVLHFSSPLPGGQCQIEDCHPQPSHGGTLASARPGVPIAVPRKRAGSGARSSTPGDESPNAGGVAGPGGGQVRITYQVTEQWSGGFAEQITIGGLAGQGGWSLAVAYPGARIAGVQGATWLWRSTDSGVAQGAVQGSPGGDQQGGNQPGGNGTGGNQQGGGQSSGGQGVAQFVITVDGQPMPPSGCSFNGQRCAFSAAGPN